MATDILPYYNRKDAPSLFNGELIASRFHQLFDINNPEPASRSGSLKKKENKKSKKKTKVKAKEKNKQKREWSPERIDASAPNLEVHTNPSSYVVYSSVRQAVLEHQVKQISHLYSQMNTNNQSDSESEDDGDEKPKDAINKMPKVVNLGLVSVFELIRETRQCYPALCIKALQALLDMLQGQTPEGLKNEPIEIIESLYELLMEVASSSNVGDSCSQQEANSLTALTCSCLLSLVIATGNTGKILSACAATLMSPSQMASQSIKLPGILVALQKSVQAVLLGKTLIPEWLTQGVKEKALSHMIFVHKLNKCNEKDCAITSDGKYLYLFNENGLHKVGSGYSYTIKGHVYTSNQSFHNGEKGWLASCVDGLFYQSLTDTGKSLVQIDPETLKEVGSITYEGDGFGPNVMFSDGTHLGHVAAGKDDSFVVRTFKQSKGKLSVHSETPLKLARRCLDVMGTAAFDSEVDLHTISTGFDEEPVFICAGKDFAFIRTSGGKILYSGKSQVLGIKQGGPAAGKWAELPITKSPKIVQCSVGHDGQHALMVTEDGSTFFVGTPKRGEDGDASFSKARRQPKALKPKKMIRIEGKNIVQTACNCGTTAVVTKEGEVFMFGKDTSHCDHASGHVTDLKDVIVTNMALGKAHAVALTNKGHVYTFGINNKGQCGRDFLTAHSRELSTNVNMAEEEEEAEDEFIMCASGKHQWRQDQCLVCTHCGECTGYGSSCINSDKPRVSGAPCGCGGGDSGCSACGVCRTCAGENAAQGRPDASAGLFEVLARAKDVPIDLNLIHQRTSRNFEHLRRFEEKRGGKNMKARNKLKVKADGHAEVVANSDYEQDHAKLVSLPPSRVELPTDKPVIQIASGQHHTVLLLEGGEVYTFGSNHYGQLGVGDTTIRGTPARVRVKHNITQIAAGSNHTVLLTASGHVITFGSYKKGQLGRDEEIGKDRSGPWHAVPALVSGIGPKHGRRANWVGASGDQTFMRIDESLINAHTLAKSKIFANQTCIGLVPTSEDGIGNIKCLMINTKDGNCKSFSGSDQAKLFIQSVALDPAFDVLWAYDSQKGEVECYNVLHSEIQNLQNMQTNLCSILSPDLAIPMKYGTLTTRSHSALHILACLDTLTTTQQLNMTVSEEESEKISCNKVYTKEDFSVVNRFEGLGGGWGYSGHSIEAVRFSTDTDILLGGFGLFGGRGEYFGKIKVYDLGMEGGDNETDGELLAETEEMPYECGAREKFPVLFEEPIALQAHHWYVAWARISGPSSDCGSGGQMSVIADDQVVFKFKSSKRSNNGTDVNAGQIPQILYRLPAHDSNSSGRQSDLAEPAHILSTDFSVAVTPECFDSLLMLLNWSWNTFCGAVEDMSNTKGLSRVAAVMDLERLVYINSACLRLVRIYVNEVYPSTAMHKKTPVETARLAECVADARSLQWKMLAESQRHLESLYQTNNHMEELGGLRQLAERILQECHHTFVACFHAFYPTSLLKWTCLCDLLTYMDQATNCREGGGRLLAAVMEALCHPTIKLTSIMPITGSCISSQEMEIKGHMDDNKDSAAQNSSRFPLLVQHMMQRAQHDGTAGHGSTHWTFKEMLDKLLNIVVMPVRQGLSQGKWSYSPLLVSNTCSLLSAIISELSAAATGAEMEMQGTGQPLLKTPNRFAWTTQSPYWNTGNGSPDALCFQVDRAGIVIAGVSVYGGGGQYEYEIELLDDQSDSNSDVSHTGRWNSLELIKGSFGPDDCIGDIIDVKFDTPIPIKENKKYAFRLRNRGPRTLNGDGGVSKVKCPDGTTITYSPCSLSNNGTNHTRGQIPQILYYSLPQEGECQLQNTKALAEYQARENVINVASVIFRVATDLLQRAQGMTDENSAELLGGAPIFTVLLPMIAAYISPVAAIDPRAAVKILGLIQEILPPVCQLNCQLSHLLGSRTASPSLPPPPELASPPNQMSPNQVMALSPGSPTLSALGPTPGSLSPGESLPPDPSMLYQSPTFSLSPSLEHNTTSSHYAIVESDHPYKPATVANYKVKFPSTVRWMTLEFDPKCGTAQIEDSLQLFVPGRGSKLQPPSWNTSGEANGQMDKSQWWTVLHKFYGSYPGNWPTMAVILPGNEVCFSLETASDYVKDDKSCFYGFKCTVIGYEWTTKLEEGLKLLECGMSCLGGMCAASLMKKEIMLPPTWVEEGDDDVEVFEDGAHEVFGAHSSLLSKGFALSHPPTISQALEGNLPFANQTNEGAFLRDFVSCTPGSSGGRLAAWLQPDSYVDPKQCDIICNKDDLKSNWPAVITVQTKDQYGQLVFVPDLRVELKAVPVMKEMSNEELKKQKRISRYDMSNSALFGGHPPPRLDVPYQVTVTDKDAYHSICMMKAYENYSFEELRYASPVLRRPSENMLVRSNNDGTYGANWTPGGTGFYNLFITVDGFETGEVYKVEVKEPPKGVQPPAQNTTKKTGHQPSKMRRFVGQWSAGLRVRIAPCLQSEQVGIIQPSGIISFIDEIHNDDGVWLRLSMDSIKKWCAGSGFNEAWALQYNQHLGRTLLVPVEEPKSILDEIIKDTILRRLPELMREKQSRKGGPGGYTVVKCGSSGHNIRCGPDLKATPTGMLVMSNQIVAMEEITNVDGIWVKLDEESMKQYCHETDGEAWVLVRGQDEITYLLHESEGPIETEEYVTSPFSMQGASSTASNTSPGKGFDFSIAQQTPTMSCFSTPEAANSSYATTEQPSASSNDSSSAFDSSGFSSPPIIFGTDGKSPGPAWPTFGRPGPPPSAPVAVPSPSGAPRSPAARLGGPLTAAPRPGSPKVSEKRDLGSLKDIPPELQGVSVKDLVKALGESRVNGNGATPPRTPPGTPKKTLSRSSSPKAIPMPSVGSHGSHGSPRGTSPLAPPSPRSREALLPNASSLSSPSRTPPRTPPKTPPTSRRESTGSYSTPPQTPSANRRSAPPACGASPRMASPSSRSSPARSDSSSPQRSPFNSLSRQTSSSPVRAGSLSSTPEGTMKGHFSIGSASPKEEARFSPKPSRKDRGRQLRSKRERAASPGNKEKTTPQSRSRSGSLPGERTPRERVKEAMAPSVSECMRAVFAAFMWHEGIVHDAMACASFLKFHPTLPKEMPKMEPSGSASTSRDNTPPTTLQRPTSVPNGGPVLYNLNRIVRSGADMRQHKERCMSESKASDSTPVVEPSSSQTTETPESELPVALQYIVYFWEELSLATQKVIQGNLILPSPSVNAKTKRSEKKEKDKSDKKPKKSRKEMKPLVLPGRGNLFGDAAGGLMGAGERETMCELCGGMFPHPVTYHMRQAHPGCSRHAGGQGYNSGGNFSGGWAGNCGDGGIGGSTWYLMCDRCREKYLRDKRQALKERSIKKSKKKSTPAKQGNNMHVMEPHYVMKNNALFLLELASAAGLSLPNQTRRQGKILPSVSEDSLCEQCPFAPTPFLYLSQRGATAADSAFVDDMIFSGEDSAASMDSNHLAEARYIRGDGGLHEIKKVNMDDPSRTPRSAVVSPEGEILAGGRQAMFQRSISEIASSTNMDENIGAAEAANNRLSRRKRNNSFSEGGISLLKNPSAPMVKLIQGANKALSGGSNSIDRSLQNMVMCFVIQRHDLMSLKYAMKQGLRKAACRVYALQAYNWLLRSVTTPMCIHDLLWFFVASLVPSLADREEELENEEDKEKKDHDHEKEVCMCEHPLSDITIAGEAVHPLPIVFHTFLQSVSDVMMYLPPGSALQQMAVRCWCLKFLHTDHVFLHKSHVFSNISKILSKSEEEWEETANAANNLAQEEQISCVEALRDITGATEMKASSRQAMIASLTDNSTETFWESGDEDRNKTKTINIQCGQNSVPHMCYVHIDNSRDLGNKVANIVFSGGTGVDDLIKLKQMELEPRFTGWVSCCIPVRNMAYIRIEAKGPDNSLRLRQIKVLGEMDGASLTVGAQPSALIMQQRNCEAETLKVFRLLTSQVFGKLILEDNTNTGGGGDAAQSEKPSLSASGEDSEAGQQGEVDLKEHMVGILFSRSKLSHLQKQVCTHIVQAIRKETQRVQEEWEASLAEENNKGKHGDRTSDAYCFELMSMVLALSGSVVGRAYLAQQHTMVQDLLSLLHTSTPRVQRQVTALLRRVLPQVSPTVLAGLLGVPALPPKDFSILTNSASSSASGDNAAASQSFDPDRPGILDVFLSCIAKVITVQTKVKGQAGKTSSYRLHNVLPTSDKSSARWWLRGQATSQLGDTIISLLKDMASGKLCEEWASVTKGAIAEAILALTKLDEKLRVPSECIKTPTLWLALASLCVLDQEHVERLSSGQWSRGGGANNQGGSDQPPPRPTCDNHDDGETIAMILCTECGNLCADCDRFLHLHRRTRSHHRQVFKEEEEAIKVDLHEGCGRTKLFWVMALADSKMLKAMVEFRDGAKGKVADTGISGTCRFCGASNTTGLLAIGNVCANGECQDHAKNACSRTLSCGHLCGGIKDEKDCLPCLHGCSGPGGEHLKQDADDMCMICFTEALSAAPAVQLTCGHVFHMHCCRNVLQGKWLGPRISFGFSQCPICKADINHAVLQDSLKPIRDLYEDVRRKALMRLEYEGLHKAEAITTPKARFYNDPAAYAMDRYAYYVCFKCKKAYYGGEVRCEEQAAGGDDYNPAELVCGGCSDVSRAQMCPKHGTDFLEYKCRYCCSVAVFFCFGTTHFCNACHDDFQRVTNVSKQELPHCPAGPKAKQLEGEECPLHVQHPPTGEEFALGCGVCRNAHTF